jgi:peptidoglycan/xylan/chitin deacetylase (PgdA/CDA1 family)
MNLARHLFESLSPAGHKARLSVLIFHRVLPEPDPIFPNEIYQTQFDEICGWMKSWFNVLPLDEAAKRLASGTLPARAACITFDDGYADNCEIALPILKRHGLCATFFIATGFLNGGRMWNDTLIESIRGCKQSTIDLSSLELGQYPLLTLSDRQNAISTIIDLVKYQEPERRNNTVAKVAELAQVALPNNLMLTSDQVITLHRAGMQIGAHTVSHPILAGLDHKTASHEILTSKQYLEQLLGDQVTLFAYPNGKPGSDYNAESVQIARQLGFAAAVSTQWGTSTQGSDVFQIRRFTPWDRSKLRFAARMLMNLRHR